MKALYASFPLFCRLFKNSCRAFQCQFSCEIIPSALKGTDVHETNTRKKHFWWKFSSISIPFFWIWRNYKLLINKSKNESSSYHCNLFFRWSQNNFLLIQTLLCYEENYTYRAREFHYFTETFTLNFLITFWVWLLKWFNVF